MMLDFQIQLYQLLATLTSILLILSKHKGQQLLLGGVGTNLITSKDNPAFGGVYKLAAVMNDDGTFAPKIKLSENSEKITNPGNKTIYRIYDNEGMIKADLIALTDEKI